jgi:hypothetical protein
LADRISAATFRHELSKLLKSFVLLQDIFSLPTRLNDTENENVQPVRNSNGGNYNPEEQTSDFDAKISRDDAQRSCSPNDFSVVKQISEILRECHDTEVDDYDSMVRCL